MEIETIKELVVKEFDYTVEACFGNWISGIFFEYEELSSFKENKEAFFILLRKLLADNKIVALPPEQFYSKGRGYSVPTKDMNYYRSGNLMPVWDVEHDFIVGYMRDVFPKNVRHESDDALNDFWYGNKTIRIAWVEPETGDLISS